MKPLLSSEIATFLKRFDDFKESEIRSIEIISPTEIELTLATQDRARAFDWITVTLLCSGISDAQLIEANKFTFIDMSEGITILYDSEAFYLAIGSYTNINTLKNAPLYIVSKSIKYSEGAF